MYTPPHGGGVYGSVIQRGPRKLLKSLRKKKCAVNKYNNIIIILPTREGIA